MPLRHSVNPGRGYIRVNHIRRRPRLEYRRRRSRPRHHQQGARAAEAVPVAPASVNARLSAAEIAALTQGQLVGPADVTVAGVAPIDRAGPDDLSFLASKRYLPYFQQSRAAVVLCKPDLAQESGGPPCRVIVRDPHVALLSVIAVLYPEPTWSAGVHPTAVIGRGAMWDEPVAIGPYAVQIGRAHV